MESIVPIIVALIVAVPSIILSLVQNKQTTGKLDHITFLTNSTMAQANNRIASLETEAVILKKELMAIVAGRDVPAAVVEAVTQAIDEPPVEPAKRPRDKRSAKKPNPKPKPFRPWTKKDKA